MDQLVDEVSNAYNARFKREQEEMAEQKQAQEDAKRCKFIDDTENEVQSVKQQISNQKRREIIIEKMYLTMKWLLGST